MSTQFCCYNNCFTKKQEGIVVHTFPKNYVMGKKWIYASGNRKLLAYESEETYKKIYKRFICDKHFDKYSYSNYGTHKLHVYAVPIVFNEPNMVVNRTGLKKVYQPKPKDLREIQPTPDKLVEIRNKLDNEANQLQTTNNMVDGKSTENIVDNKKVVDLQPTEAIIDKADKVHNKVKPYRPPNKKTKRKQSPIPLPTNERVYCELDIMENQTVQSEVTFINDTFLMHTSGYSDLQIDNIKKDLIVSASNCTNQPLITISNKYNSASNTCLQSIINIPALRDHNYLENSEEEKTDETPIKIRKTIELVDAYLNDLAYKTPPSPPALNTDELNRRNFLLNAPENVLKQQLIDLTVKLERTQKINEGRRKRVDVLRKKLSRIQTKLNYSKEANLLKKKVDLLPSDVRMWFMTQLNHKYRKEFSIQEKEFALKLFQISRPAYRYFLQHKFILPSKTTIRDYEKAKLKGVRQNETKVIVEHVEQEDMEHFDADEEQFDEFMLHEEFVIKPDLQDDLEDIEI